MCIVKFLVNKKEEYKIKCSILFTDNVRHTQCILINHKPNKLNHSTYFYVLKVNPAKSLSSVLTEERRVRGINYSICDNLRD